MNRPSDFEAVGTVTMHALRSAALVLAFGWAFVAVTSAQTEVSVWWEGEDAKETNFPKTTTFSEKSFKKRAPEILSGGRWLTNVKKHEGSAAFAKYRVNVPEDGEYWFYVRKFWQHGPFRWRFDQAPWRVCPRNVHLIDHVHIRKYLCVNWVSLGKVKLTPGDHDFELRLLPQSQTACFDAFFLTKGTQVPFGANPPEKPKQTNGPDEWYPVYLGRDDFSEKSVIDMSRFIPAPAGQYGFLKRVGHSLKFEKAPKPVKFWGVGANVIIMPRHEQNQRARYLRKHGVNMVRQHPVFGWLGPMEHGSFDVAKLNQLDWWFAKLKEHGIYMTWSVFYGQKISEEDGYDPQLFKELGSKGNTSGLVNVERALQDLQLKYLKALLHHKNTFTGLRYVDDPALAVLEIQNEDCVFWHTPLNSFRDPKKVPLHSRRLRQKWCNWAKRRYGDEKSLKKAWGKLRKGDSLTRGELELCAAYHLGAEGPKFEFVGQTKRAGDFIQFLTELQRGFYERREKELRQLGFKGVTITTAWRAGGPAAGLANTYCDTACDMIDRHGYFGGGAGGHEIRKGFVSNESHLNQPGGGLLAIGMHQVEDRPFATTEWTQMAPNQWKLEAAPLLAFYGMGLQGWDASYHFLNEHPGMANGWPRVRSYATDTPHYMGQFPVLFFALHQGHIKEAPIAAARRVKEADLYRGVDVLSHGPPGVGYDQNKSRGVLGTPQKVLAIGRVTTSFNGGRSERIEYGKYWDRQGKVVHSMTGQLTWDYGNEVVILRTPKSQAVIGRAGGATFELPGVTVAVKTPFVSLVLAPLDNELLVQSQNILITALARDRQHKTVYEVGEYTDPKGQSKTGMLLKRVGTAPLYLEPVEATLKIKGTRPRQVNVLDVYGVPTGQQVELAADGSFHIDGTYMSYYYQVKR